VGGPPPDAAPGRRGLSLLARPLPDLLDVGDNRPVENGWTHIGRLWTNGEPHLAVDADARHRWLGHSEDEYFDRIINLGPDETGIAVGDRTAAVVGADGDDYRRTLAAALRHAGDPTEPTTLIEVRSGAIASRCPRDQVSGHPPVVYRARRREPLRRWLLSPKPADA
jgi:hypothetical protein